MYKNLLTLFLSFLFGLSLQAQNPTVILPNLEIVNTESEFDIDVKVSNFDSLISMQFTIQWDPAKLKYLSVDNWNIPFLDEGSFGDASVNVDAGVLPVVWFDDYLTGVDLDDDATIFTIRMKPIGNAGDTAVLSFVSIPASIEFVNVQQVVVPNDVEHGQVIFLDDLSMTTEILKKPNLQLIENYPNPFSDFTNISFELKERTNITLTITDIVGREIYRDTQDRNSGIHEVKIDGSILPSSGEYFYQVQTTEHQLTGKLIFVK